MLPKEDQLELFTELSSGGNGDLMVQIIPHHLNLVHVYEIFRKRQIVFLTKKKKANKFYNSSADKSVFILEVKVNSKMIYCL